MLALVAAMNQEVSGLKRLMTVTETIHGEDHLAYRGKLGEKEVLLVRTGVGRERAERAGRSILERYPVSALVSFGFAGGLTPEARGGDIVLGATLVCSEAPQSVCQSDAGLVEGALQVLVGEVTRVRQGRCLTVVKGVSQPAVKEKLGQSFQADVVEMESYWLAQVAATKAVPFLAVRAISDTLFEPLPPLGQVIDAYGGWRWGRAVAHFLLHPRQFTRLLALNRNVVLARHNLTVFLARLAERIE